MTDRNGKNKRKSEFFSQLTLAESTIRNYRLALNAKFLLELLREDWGVNDIFEMTNLKDLWDLYSKVNIHPSNVRCHRLSSAIIMKYIIYLNGGEKYRKRKERRNKGSKKLKRNIICD